jgi:hypothetical protein
MHEEKILFSGSRIVHPRRGIEPDADDLQHIEAVKWRFPDSADLPSLSEIENCINQKSANKADSIGTSQSECAFEFAEFSVLSYFDSLQMSSIMEIVVRIKAKREAIIDPEYERAIRPDGTVDYAFGLLPDFKGRYTWVSSDTQIAVSHAWHHARSDYISQGVGGEYKIEYIYLYEYYTSWLDSMPLTLSKPMTVYEFASLTGKAVELPGGTEVYVSGILENENALRISFKPGKNIDVESDGVLSTGWVNNEWGIKRGMGMD